MSNPTVFLVLRRMRTPLIVLIVIFAVSVLGLTLIPGVDAEGQPRRMGFFEAFYFMSYTATTIGFGELPYPFTGAQRLWVVVTIYLTVIGWAYAIGKLLSLLQDRAFREALALRRFRRGVARMREPFLLVAGYGRTGELLGRGLDDLGRRFVVVDIAPERVETLDLGSYRADVPGLVGDARDPGRLVAAGLGHPCCEGVLALTNDDEANLAVTMSAALLRPDLPVVARATTPAIEDRMHAFGTPTVVNAFDRFGDKLRLAVRAPSTYRLVSWLESGPGAELPPLVAAPQDGPWVVCGSGRFGYEATLDLLAEGLPVTVVDLDPERVPPPGATAVVGDASDPEVMERAGVEEAAGFVAATDNDTTNLSLVAAAVRLNADLYVAARENEAANAPLFAAMRVDAVLVPSEVVAHDVYAQLSTPLLWRLLQEVPRRDDAWAAALVERLAERCGATLQELWKVRLRPEEAPAVVPLLADGPVPLGDLLRDPDDRERRLDVVPLLQLHEGGVVVEPGDDRPVAAGDELLLAARAPARRGLETTLAVEAAALHVLQGRRVPAGWVWRQLSRR
ncbi:potassium channel family protein [Vallicoccus soli]|uniref:Potassium transporter TrkA n=1 Tax=Vallicoccus soli TaxID=2339232 RepID=A0A3A3Z2Z8_9ACTN|nr:potassium channel family protein [Vallicoccus soli]RJK94831.1 potassium transporter TrkA [Vallicoccus soli]